MEYILPSYVMDSKALIYYMDEVVMGTSPRERHTSSFMITGGEWCTHALELCTVPLVTSLVDFSMHVNLACIHCDTGFLKVILFSVLILKMLLEL